MGLGRVRKVVVAGAFACAVACVVVAVMPSVGFAVPLGRTSRWVRPVDGPVVQRFRPPANPYGPGHRGVDFSVPPGTPVRAAGAGVVAFAGEIAGTHHVTVVHPGGLRTSYSFLAAVSVAPGAAVTPGEPLGASGEADPDSGHDGTVVHVSVRRGTRYLDPMRLFGPVDLGAIVHLAPLLD